MIRKGLACSLVVAAAALVIPSPPLAHAGSGLNTFSWSAAGKTVSSSNYNYSNMAGFVQALVNSNTCNLAVDGLFGSLTTWNLAVAQNGIIGSNNGGVMNGWSWDGFQNAVFSDGGGTYTRLSNTLEVDGYGTQRRSYYGGNSGPTSALGWNPFSSQWLFSQYPDTAPYSLVPATVSRTISSVPACS